MDAFPLAISEHIKYETIESVFTTFADRSQSGHRNARSANKHFWKMRLETSLMKPEYYRNFFAFGVKQEGRFQVFTVPSTIMSQPQGVATGTPLVQGAHSAGDFSIVTDGWGNNIKGIMKAGDFIQFAGHRKVYMVVEDADSNVSGVAEIQIKPALVYGLADNETVISKDVQFYMAFTEDPFVLDTNENKYASFTLEMEEVWNE